MRPPSMDASAILPTPTPHRLKKWRRVSNSRSLSSGVISLPCHEIVQVEEHAAKRSPGGQLRNALRVYAFLALQVRARIRGEHLLLHHQQTGRGRIGAILIALQCQET